MMKLLKNNAKEQYKTKKGLPFDLDKYAKELSKKGHRIHIITQAGDNRADVGSLNDNVVIHEINFNEEPFLGTWRIDKLFPLSEIRYAFAVYKKIKEMNFYDGK